MAAQSKFEIHYFLEGDSHSVDAFVRNKCEAEFLALAHELLDILGIEATLEAEAHLEGGLRDIWKFIGSNSTQLSFIVAVIALIISLMPSTDEELVALQKEDTRLSIEEKKLTIEKLKFDLKSDSLENEQKEKTASAIITQSHKITVRRSNFYRHVTHAPKVEKIGFTPLDDSGKPISNESIILRSDFSKFILASNKLPVEIIEDARIEIVSPVLRDGKAKWKGVFIEPPPIAFEMNDKIFKDAVLAKQISFKNGDVYSCVLEIHREINEVGEIVPTRYIVQTVRGKVENGLLAEETESGKKYRREMEARKAQTTFDFQ